KGIVAVDIKKLLLFLLVICFISANTANDALKEKKGGRSGILKPAFFSSANWAIERGFEQATEGKKDSDIDGGIEEDSSDTREEKGRRDYSVKKEKELQGLIVKRIKDEDRITCFYDRNKGVITGEHTVRGRIVNEWGGQGLLIASFKIFTVVHRSLATGKSMESACQLNEGPNETKSFVSVVPDLGSI